MFSLKDISSDNFESAALEVFHKQARDTPAYQEYCSLLNIHPPSVNSLAHVPFLPVSFFKTKIIVADGLKEEIVFTSSSTTGTGESRHYVPRLSLYEEAFTESFRLFYGSPAQYCFLFLLPSYQEREGSSLIYMCHKLLSYSRHPNSGFFLNNLDELADILQENESYKQKTILLGVTYALLDLAGKLKGVQLKNTIIMETGGMKGRRKEMIREDVHAILKNAFGVPAIHSEYGMTELLSQAYSAGEGIFKAPPWMRILLRDVNDPLDVTTEKNKTGALNIIDLANIHSCSFIATDDLGKLYDNGSFEVLGRMDNSDVRGCNLLVG